MGGILFFVLPPIIIIVIYVSLDMVVWAVNSFVRWMRNLFEIDL